MWRGTIARKRVRRMMAVRRIAAAYRRYKLRAYVRSLQKVFQ